MLDRPVRRILDPWLDRLAARLATWRVPANGITVAGFLIGAAGCVAIAAQHYRAALALILLNRLADGLDGCVARRTHPTDLGGFLDVVLDTVFYSGVPFAFALADPERLLPACFLIYSFIGTGGSFLAFAVIAAKRGVVSGEGGRKSFFYSVGLMEGSETIVFFVLFCLFPAKFAALAWTFGSLCWLTTALRVAAGIVEFRRVAEVERGVAGVERSEAPSPSGSPARD
jgi:phosphatidylglycerophosphate synthase